MTTLAPRYKDLIGAPESVLTSGAQLSTIVASIGSEVSEFVINQSCIVTTNTTIPANVAVSVVNGAIISISTGVTLTINGPFSAGVYQVFDCTGTGKVVFNSQFTTVGYPEWWGAVTNDGGEDCLAAISACIEACSVTQLQMTDYFISSTLKIQTPSRTLRGFGFNYLGGTSDSATRVVVLGGSATVIQMGPDTEPATINDFLTDVRVENLQVTRSIVPVSGSNCAGILNQFTLYSYIDKVKATEHEIGFHYGGTVQAHTTDCYSFRSTAGTGVGTDKFYGYYVDGIGYDIGAAGGNASIYFDTCNSSGAGAVTSNSTGFFLQGNFTDCYIANCELNATGYGISIEGNGLTTKQYGNNDVLITSPVIDVFTFAGIRFNNISKFGSISVNGGYCAPAATTSAVAGLFFNESLGQVSVTDFQIIANYSTTCTGITAINSSNIESRTQIIDCNAIPISLSNVDNSRFLDHVTNYGNTSSSVCQLVANCSRNYFQVFAAGKASAFTIGYQGLGTTNEYNELNCTGIDAACIAGGSADKLVWNSTNITTTGAIASGTTNYASGVMA